MSYFQDFIFSEEGATAIEYGLITALIAVILIAALIGAGEQIKTVFETVEEEVEGVVT